MLDKIEEEEKKEKNITLKDMFKILIRNKQLLIMALVVLLYTTASSFITALGQNFLYFRYGFEGDRMFILTVIFAVGTIISQFFFPVLANKFKRMQIVKYSILVSVIGYLLFMLFALLPFGVNIGFALLCVAAVLVFAGQGFFYMTMLIMLTNTIEYDEWKNNERNDAVTFSVRPFMVKLSSAIQQMIISVILVVCGLYSITNKIGEIVTGIDKGEIDSVIGVGDINALLSGVGQPQMVGLTLCMTIIPALMLVVCYIVIKKKYIIDEELYETILSDLKEREN
jgi:melibiose permease/lactose/raffinose/galactose permease